MPDIEVNVDHDQTSSGSEDFSSEPAVSPQPAAPPSDSEPAAASGNQPSASVPGKLDVIKQSGKNARLAVGVVVVVVVLALLAWALKLNSDNSQLKKDNASLNNQITQLNANPQAIIQKQTNDLISKVSKLMQLPTGETPTVAEVSDATAAKKQSAFFNDAQNGDKVLMYVNAHEAILYRPSTNKIILVAPLTFSNSTASSTSSTTKH